MKDPVAQLFTEFFKEALHGIEIRASCGQLFKSNAPLLTNPLLVSPCATGDQHHGMGSVHRFGLLFKIVQE